MFYPNYLLTKFKNGKDRERKMAEWKQNESCKMQSKNNSASDSKDAIGQIWNCNMTKNHKSTKKLGSCNSFVLLCWNQRVY